MAKLILDTGVAINKDTKKGLKMGTAIEVPLEGDCCKLDCCDQSIKFEWTDGKQVKIDLAKLAALLNATPEAAGSNNTGFEYVK